MCITLASYRPANAQNLTPGISCGFKQDTISVRVGETFSNTIWVNNNTAKQIKLVQVYVSGQKSRGLLKLPDTIILRANERKWYPLKYMADRQTIAKQLQGISIRLRTLDNLANVQASATFYARLENVQALFLDTDQQELYLDRLSSQTRLMIRCFNRNLIPISFRLELIEIPEGLEFVGKTENLSIQPGEQINLPFMVRNKLNSKLPADFAVTIQAINQNGSQVASKQIRVMSISSERRLVLNQTPFYQNRPNTIAFHYMMANKSTSSYQLHGNGKYKWTDHQRLDYQLNMDYFNSQKNQKGFNMYNTHINYDNKSWGIKLGNLYESLDFNLNGRGIEGRVYLGENRSINVYAMDNNYLIFSEFNKQKMGNTLAVTFNEKNSIVDNKRVVLLRNNNLWTKINTTLFSSIIKIPIKAHHNMGLEAGYSNQTYRMNNKQSKHGAAFGLNYNLKKNNTNFSSNNYYSSPYYGGLRKGLLQLDNRVLITLAQDKSLRAGINLVRNKSKYLSYTNSQYLLITNNYGYATYELGYNHSIKKWSIAVTPYYFSQYMDVDNLNARQADSWKSSSLQTKLNVAYSHSGQDFSFESDHGYTFRNISGKRICPFLSWRMNFNYRNPVIGFTAFSQFNSYYLTDALGISENPKYSIYSLGPNTHFSLFDGKIAVNANASYNYNDYGANKSNSYSFTSNVRCLLKGQWAISADAYYSFNQQKSRKYNPIVGMEHLDFPEDQYYTYRFNNLQLRIGIEKSFGRNPNDERTKLEMTYFEDHNGNGYRDKGEPLVPGLLVKIEGLAAITNAHGKVRFTGVKNKAYIVSIVNSKGWNMLQPIEVLLNKNKKLEIPLVKTGRLAGSLNYIADKYTQGTIELAGIRVKAVTGNGNVYDTITNERGLFSFYLPENKYTVYIDTEDMPFSITDQKKVVEIKRNTVARLVFDYKSKHQKVEVIKFK